MTEKKTIAESLNDAGNKVKECGTIISVVGAILVSAGLVIRYVTGRKT